VTQKVISPLTEEEYFEFQTLDNIFWNTDISNEDFNRYCELLKRFKKCGILT
jgi:hypothetical protein